MIDVCRLEELDRSGSQTVVSRDAPNPTEGNSMSGRQNTHIGEDFCSSAGENERRLVKEVPARSRLAGPVVCEK